MSLLVLSKESNSPVSLLGAVLQSRGQAWDPLLQCFFVSVFHSWLLILTQMSKVALSSLIGSSRYFCSPRVLGASWCHVLAGSMSVPKAAAAKAIPPQSCGCCKNIFFSH